MVDRLDDRTRVEELLPLYVNGTLGPDERAEVATHIASDEELRREAQLLSQIRAVMKADEPDYTPNEMGIARLNRAIDAEAASSGWRRGVLSGVIAAAGTAVGFFALGSISGSDASFVQAGVTSSERVLVVAFRPTALEKDISDLLVEHNVTIVDGPSAIGLYRVEVPESQEITEVLAALRAATTIVESAGTTE